LGGDMRIVKLLAMVMGFIIAGIGVFGVAAPSVFLEFGRSLQTPNVLYIIAAIRIIFGAVLLWVAPVSRTPKTFRVLGVLIVVAGVLTPFIGIERSRAMLDWWLTQGPLFMRAWAGVAIVFGLFIVYAITTSRRSAE
jgi:uncharacterized membrane protein